MNQNQIIMNTKLIWAMLLILVFTSCSEEDILSPLENNQVPPGTVENVRVENLPGKVRLTYTLPEDKDLLYVVAKYELENGTEVEVKSSYYNNSMLLEGFAGQSDRNVNLYAVNRSEIESEPVIVTVSPLEAPIFDVFESLEVSPDFGGIKINSRNNTNEDIALLVMEKMNRTIGRFFQIVFIPLPVRFRKALEGSIPYQRNLLLL